mgnify:CR=1 FL=1
MFGCLLVVNVVFLWMMVNKFILNFSLIIIKLYPVNPLIGGYLDSNKFISSCRINELLIYWFHNNQFSNFSSAILDKSESLDTRIKSLVIAVAAIKTSAS